MVSSPESVEVVQPAFMRLEAEGGLLLIEVGVTNAVCCADQGAHVERVGTFCSRLLCRVVTCMPWLMLESVIR
jgi:hypothetical protein